MQLAAYLVRTQTIPQARKEAMSDKDRDKDAVDSATADEVKKPDNTTRADTSADTDADANDSEQPNPPHTTTGWLTVPKFGSAGSGGLEDEPGPERD